ncbi:MAG: AMIN-like domain-containing (lipo)protein [Gemmatimonadales bacterium]
MRAAVVHVVVALPILAACRQNHTPRADLASAQGAAAEVQDTATFVGTTGVVHRARRPAPGAPSPILAAVHVSREPGYDRVVFEFGGDSLPGYHLEYATGAVVRCGSGDPVSIGGTARLVVRLEPAQAHDERGRPTIVERERAPGLPAIKEMKLICDFEGQVEWVLGAAATLPYRILEGMDPPRLTVDVRHAP